MGGGRARTGQAAAGRQYKTHESHEMGGTCRQTQKKFLGVCFLFPCLFFFFVVLHFLCLAYRLLYFIYPDCVVASLRGTITHVRAQVHACIVRFRASKNAASNFFRVFFLASKEPTFILYHTQGLEYWHFHLCSHSSGRIAMVVMMDDCL